MTLATAYWCVLIAALLPYVWITVAKTGGQRYDNRDPRGWMARQDNPRSIRANAAQLNSYEAFAPFAAGVILAQLAGVPAERIAVLAVAFVLLRVLHGVFYVTNVHALRSLVWFGGFACVLVLLAQAALRAGTTLAP
ncbi:MAG: MAPEG family protein [Lysobacter sp.]